MNKTKVTTRKGSKAKTKKESPEVFVLPPNLLEKLGINLGQYGSTSGNTTQSQITDVNLNSQDCRPCKNKPTLHKDPITHVPKSSETESSSIIETAELMKKSVFLSPTFISNNTSIIQGEIEIVGNVAAEGVDDNAMNNEHCAEKTKDVSKDMQIESVYTVPNLINTPFSSSTQENKQCDRIANGSVETHELQMQTLIDDHADEAYSSDCSNSNIVCSVKSDTKKCNDNKINIISEQIILPTQFYKLKSSFSTNESSLINVPINTIVIGQNQNSNEQVGSNVDFDPIIAETITPADVAIVNECDMYEQNCVKEDDVIIEDMELLQNISNIDISAVLNVSESELVINTQNKTAFPLDLEGFQLQHMQAMNIHDQAALDHVNVVPCHINFVDVNNVKAGEKEDISADTKICLEDNDNTVKEYVEVNESPSIKKQHDDINITKTMSNEHTSHMYVDRNNLISRSKEAKNVFQKPVADQYHVEIDLKNKCSPANEYLNIEVFDIKEKKYTQENASSEKFKSLQKPVLNQNHMEIDPESKCSHANKYPNIELVDVKEKMNTPEHDSSEEFRCLQSGETDLVSRNNDIFATHNQQSLQSFTKNVSRTVNKYERRSCENKNNSPKDNSLSNLCMEYKNTAVEETSTKSPILYIKHYKKQVCEKYECQHEKKEDHEKSELEVDPKINSVSHEDKVREIAKYLSEFADLKKRKDLIQNINVSSKTLTNKNKRTNSKSSIQGVEKPGGSRINKNNLNCPPIKTYERRGRQKCNTISSCELKEPKISTKAIDIVDSESANNICNEIEVCLCSDFGQLMSYDDVSSYEHIHFWNNARTECTTPDVIFSIYSENAPVLDIDRYIQSDVEEYPSKISDVVPYKLCWNEMKHMSDIKFYNSGTRNEIYSSVDVVEKKNNENSEQQEVERENVLEGTMITVNSVENCEGVASNENHPDEPAVHTGQKREYSAVLVDNGEPPAKKKRKETPKPVKSSPLKSPSSSLAESTSYEIEENQTQEPDNETTTKNPVLRSKSIDKAEKTDLLSTEKEDKTIICGVCQQSVKGDWIEHIALKHDYLAWKSGEPPLDVEDEVAVREHLNEITKLGGGLKCSKCGLARKYVKAYLSHFRRCRSEEKADSSSIVGTGEPAKCVNNEDLPVDAGLVKCGVCNESMHDADWNEHKATRHAYLAWKYGEPVLDVNNETAVREHLYEIAKTRVELVCAKCGLTRKTVRAYLSHTRSCAGLSESQNDSAYNVSLEAIPKNVPELPRKADAKNLTDANAGLITCGVCEESVREKDWYHHISSRHDYLAWKRGNVDLDVNNEEAVRSHLYEISKACGGLKCAKCGLTRKYVKAYLSHIKSCSGLNESQNDSTYNASTISSDEVKLPDVPSDEVKLADVPSDEVKLADVPSDEVKLGDVSSDEVKLADVSSDEVKLGDVSSDEVKLADISSDEVNLADTEVINKDIVANDVSVKCAVCEESMPNKDWYSHASQHDYLAWKVGDTALNVTDDAAVKDHLYEITKARGGLTCSNCGLTRKYVRAYLTHVKTCDGLNKSQNDSSCSIKANIVSDQELAETANVTVTKCKQDNAQIKNTPVKCGVCEETIQEEDWYSHISSRHDYLAWKFGETALDKNDDTAVKEHLYTISSACGGLTCSKCGHTKKQVKAYLAHVKSCNEVNEEKSNEDNSEEQTIEKASSFKCGVCNEVVISSHWEKHLSDNHEYLAWKDGDTPPNLDDEDEVHRHLYKFTKEFGCLVCKYCGKNRKYVKSFLEHVKACKNGAVSVVVRASTSLDLDETVDFISGGTCAVCHKEVEPTKWIQHTQKEHNYLAWREGERPWNLNDFEDVNQFLYIICKRMDGLTCNKCGLVRKYVKTYLTHIKNCNVSEFNVDADVTYGVGPSNTDEHQCAMCKELVKMQDWKTHAIEKHYNVTWIVGETPIDIKNVYAVERFLKEYKRVTGNLKCKACGTTRSSFAGFYAHIIICKKTEQEIDMYRFMCDICNKKYLCIYKNQHALMHRVQVITAENRIIKENEDNLSGKRRAAVKARTVIENYSDSISKYAHSCPSCDFGTDIEEELKTHKCEVSNKKDFSGDEDSAAEIGSSEDESGDTDVDSNISNEENDKLDDEDDDDEAQATKKRYRDPAPVISKVSRIPFKVGDVNSYIRKGDEEFCNMNFTDEVLFSGWQCQHDPVLESELTRYLPPLERSCKLRSGSNWTILNRFEAQSHSYGPCLFAGASISCIAWVPPRLQYIFEGDCNFLAIACHNGPDCPRILGGETPKHANLIQIWSFGRFRELPKLVFGIAHDFGTVWSIAWCPSGARDAAPAKEAPPTRLGLLAVACSSGSAYIFAVPYPSSVLKDNQVIHKLKPVAELRMTMCSERTPYQATSVSWSKQKEHKIVLVGYADGSTAYYDLHSDSPLLSTLENDVQVLYPYYDERPHSTCITGTDLYPVPGDVTGSDVGAWTAPTGAELAPRAGSGAPGRVRLSIASAAVAFAPQACAAVLAGDDAMMQASISELVWVPPGRRLGGTRCAAGCARCGRVACSMPPTLRLMRLHPSYSDCKKQVIAMLEMTHLAKKRKKVNDELSMTVEPLTYDEAVNKYGIEFTKISVTDRPMQQQYAAKPKTHCPERFPLADVESMAFCPSRRFHDKLAVATHSGILFLTSTS